MGNLAIESKRESNLTLGGHTNAMIGSKPIEANLFMGSTFQS